MAVDILYGSQTGTAQGYAEAVYLEATMRRLAATLQTLDSFYHSLQGNEAALLAGGRTMVILVSNTGDGDPPDNAKDFFTWITTQDDPRLLERCRACLLALGDSNYVETFNRSGRRLEEALSRLGCKWICPPVFCDADLGNDPVAEPWIEGVIDLLAAPSAAPSPDNGAESLARVMSSQLSLAETFEEPASPPPAPPSPAVQMEGEAPLLWTLPLCGMASKTAWVESEGMTGLPKLHPDSVQVAFVDGGDSASKADDGAPPPLKGPPEASRREYSHACPIVATISDVQVLTSPEAVKRVYQVTLAFDASTEDVALQAGDALGLVCENDPAIVAQLLARLALDGRQRVSISSLIPIASGTLLSFTASEYAPPAGHSVAALEEGSAPNAKGSGLSSMTLEEIFTKYVDINHFPKKSLLRHLALYCTDVGERRDLLYLCTSEASSHYMAAARGHANVADFLHTFPSCKPPLSCLLSHLPLLHPRFYSICRITSEDTGEGLTRQTVDFIYSETVYETGCPPLTFQRTGIASSFLNRKVEALLRARTGQACSGEASFNASLQRSSALVGIFPRPSPHFRLTSDPSVPVIMICTGTGISPFIGFLRSICPEERRTAPTWLIYGFRNLQHDFLFGSELKRMHSESKVLSRLSLATSRQNAPDEGQGLVALHPGYVQDVIRANSRDIHSMIFPSGHAGARPECGEAAAEEAAATAPGALIYICGEELTMIKSVNDALCQMIIDNWSGEGGCLERDAQEVVRKLASKGRIIRDIWV